MKSASPLNRQYRRTAPYVIMNNRTQSPSVAYSVRKPEQEQINNDDDNVQILNNNIPFQSSHKEEFRKTNRSLFDLVRRVQVCLIFNT